MTNVSYDEPYGVRNVDTSSVVLTAARGHTFPTYRRGRHTVHLYCRTHSLQIANLGRSLLRLITLFDIKGVSWIAVAEINGFDRPKIRVNTNSVWGSTAH